MKSCLLGIFGSLALCATATADPLYQTRALPQLSRAASPGGMNNYAEVIGTAFDSELFGSRAAIIRRDADGYFTEMSFAADFVPSGGEAINGLGDTLVWDLRSNVSATIFSFVDGRPVQTQNWCTEGFYPRGGISENGLIAGIREYSSSCFPDRGLASVRDALTGAEYPLPLGIDEVALNSDGLVAGNDDTGLRLFQLIRGSSGPGEASVEHFESLPVINPAVPTEARVVEVNELGLILLVEQTQGTPKPGEPYRSWFHVYNNVTGELTTVQDERYAQLYPTAFNNRGHVVGFFSRAGTSEYGGFIYKAGEIIELGETATGLIQVYPVSRGLNDRGEILVSGFDGFSSQIYVLSPANPARECIADFDGDRVVGLADLSFLLNRWNQRSGIFDLTGDRRIGLDDVGVMVQSWSNCPK